jgi:WD40 repeat protein
MTLRTLDGHASFDNGVAYSPDGKTVVSAEPLQMWDVASGQVVRTLETHTDYVTDVAYSPDGKTLVSASYDGTLRIWDVASGQVLRTLEGHTNHVTGVAYSPDGKTLVSASQDGTLRVWPGSAEAMIDWTYANRYVPELTAEQRRRYGLALPSDATPTPGP